MHAAAPYLLSHEAIFCAHKKKQYSTTGIVSGKLPYCPPADANAYLLV